MSKSNFTEQDLKNKGLVETSPGIFERPLTEKECRKVLDNGGSLEESGSFDKIKETLTVVKEKKAPSLITSKFLIKSFWVNIKKYSEAYEFNIVPNTKPRQTISDKWNKRKCVMQYRAFADTLRSQADMLNFQLKSPLIVEFHVPMAKSWGKRKRVEMEGKPHEQTPDCDNFCKALQDALLGQDNLISEIHARKLWSTNGRIIIYA